MSFRALQQKWYKKLEQSGFKDIEDEKGRLKVYSGIGLSEDLPLPVSRTDYSSKLYKESQAEYYRLAGQYLYDKKFKSPRDKQVWALHTQGLSFTVISEKLGLTRDSVKYRIRKMRIAFFK